MEFQSRALEIDTEPSEFYEFLEIVKVDIVDSDIVMMYRDHSVHLYDAEHVQSAVQICNTLVSSGKDVDVELEVSTDDNTWDPADLDAVEKLSLWSYNDTLTHRALLHRASINKRMTFSEQHSRYRRCQFPSVCDVEPCVVVGDDIRVHACLCV